MTCDSTATDLGAQVAALGPELVDLRLGDVGSLFSLVELVLNLSALCQVVVGLFLLEQNHSFSPETQAGFSGFLRFWHLLGLAPSNCLICSVLRFPELKSSILKFKNLQVGYLLPPQ